MKTGLTPRQIAHTVAIEALQLLGYDDHVLLEGVDAKHRARVRGIALNLAMKLAEEAVIDLHWKLPNELNSKD